MEKSTQASGLEIDIDSIADQNTRIIVRHLLNVIESQASEIVKLKAEIQKLRDENNNLKGE
jgi:cell division protein FtsB